MFSFMKTLAIFHVIKVAKSNIINIVIAIVLMIISSYFFNDFIGIDEGSNTFSLMITKWLITFILVGVVFLNMYKLFNKNYVVASANIEIDVVAEERKREILEKDKLGSKSDRIINKYKNSDQ